MAETLSRLKGFLKDSGWEAAELIPLAGDMSSRRYHRLTDSMGRTAILMDANTDTSTPAFLRMTDWLRDNGFSAPEVFHRNAADGLVLLEDLGDDSLKRCISADPANADEFYRAVIHLLLALRKRTPPDLHQPDAGELVDWTRIADDSLPNVNLTALEAFRSYLETVLRAVLKQESSLSLRDLHVENLHWLPKREGVQRLGLLDYQDAFLTHPVYDLVSLLTDARTDIPSSTRTEMIELYTNLSGDDPVALRRAFAAFSAQRNLRILAIFCRTPSKASMIPRVWKHLGDAVAHPDLAPVRADLRAALPSLPEWAE